MKSQVLQWWFPTLRASVLLASAALVGLGPATLRAQGAAPTPGLDPLCRCVVGGDSTAARGGDRDHGWTLLGAAGLALLAGLPVGGAGTPAIPFVDGPPAPTDASLPVAGGVGAPPAATTPGTPAGTAPIVARPAVAPVTVAPMADLPVPPLAFVPPKTATHLPLLAAAGVLLMGAGGLLARHQARRQRRRRRRIVTV